MPRRPSLRRLKRDIAHGLTSQLAEIVTKGRPVFDNDGNPIRDAVGEQVYKPPTAADLRTALAWLSQNNVKLDDAGREIDSSDPRGVGAALERIRAQRQEASERAEAATPEDLSHG